MMMMMMMMPRPSVVHQMAHERGAQKGELASLDWDRERLDLGEF